MEEITLPIGLRCDACNQYFGTKVELGITNHPYVLQWQAIYAIRAKKGWPFYIGEGVEIRAVKSGILELRGLGVELESGRHITVPQPSLEGVDHLQVSRALHKVAFEYELLEIMKRKGLVGAREAAQKPPLSMVARYVRYGHRSSYRPYGVEPQGAGRVAISGVRFERDPKGIIVSPPTFTGYILGLPGARFSCTLAEDPSLLHYMLNRIESMECAGYLTTRRVYSNMDSGAVIAA